MDQASPKQRALAMKLRNRKAPMSETMESGCVMSARETLNSIIELGDKAILGGGRGHNPFYSAEAKKGVHAIGGGKEESIPLNKIVSTQATVHTAKVRSMSGKMQRGTHKGKTLPTVERQGGQYVLHDGNHRAVAALRAGKRKIRAMVQ